MHINRLQQVLVNVYCCIVQASRLGRPGRPGEGEQLLPGEGEQLLPGRRGGKYLCTLEGFASSRELIKEEGLASALPAVFPILKGKNVLAEGFLGLFPGN